MPAAIQKTKDCYWISSPLLAAPLNCESFDVQKLIQAGAVKSTATGRANAWFIQLGLSSDIPRQKAVLRHFYRGGQIAKISADKFFWNGIKNSRAVAEYHLLEWMFEQGLPVPEPLGARVVKQGLLYTCDIITREIENTKTMAATLEVTNLKELQWNTIGKTIRQFHNRSIWHSDLNANNILISNNGQISVIDFDRCKVRSGEAWKNKNLLRLQRSLEKQFRLGRIKHFSEANWQSLLNGYIAT